MALDADIAVDKVIDSELSLGFVRVIGVHYLPPASKLDKHLRFGPISSLMPMASS